MSEKKQPDSPSKARIRNNQRRSRARHREYVEELKARLHQYERDGVQATLEMRQAARRVALENSRLRSLLASRGVTADEIERYLASSSDQQAPNGTLPAMGSTVMASTPPTTEQPRPPSSTNTSSPWALDTLAVVADADLRQTCCGPATQCSLADADDRDVRGYGYGYGAAPTGSPFGDATSPPRGPQTPSHASASYLEMSCTTAAHIIANMRRDGSTENAREALGCSGHEDCLVKNTTLFELLESSEAV
ncbi:hypothetical protein VTK26DRAFT_2758 [Humicola hyalothermophila]